MHLPPHWLYACQVLVLRTSSVDGRSGPGWRTTTNACETSCSPSPVRRSISYIPGRHVASVVTVTATGQSHPTRHDSSGTAWSPTVTLSRHTTSRSPPRRATSIWTSGTLLEQCRSTGSPATTLWREAYPSAVG